MDAPPELDSPLPPSREPELHDGGADVAGNPVDDVAASSPLSGPPSFAAAADAPATSMIIHPGRRTTPSPGAEPSAMDAPLINARVEVYWPDDGVWYGCTVCGFELQSLKHKLRYDDGVEETLDLLHEEWRPAPPLGSLIEIYWQEDNTWYTCEVLSFDEASTSHLVHYTDDDSEEYTDLRYDMWRPCEKPPAQPWHGKGRHHAGPAAAPRDVLGPRSAPPAAQHPRPAPPAYQAPSKGRAAAAAAVSPPEYDDYEYGAGGATREYGQVPTREKLTSLTAYIAQMGADPSLLDGWSALRYFRGVSARAKSVRGGEPRHGDSYLVFVDPTGKQYRSKVQVGRALGLIGDGEERVGAAPSGVAKRKREPVLY